MCVKNKQRITINYSVNLALRVCIVVADVNLSILTDVVPSILLITDVTLFLLGRRLRDLAKPRGTDTDAAAFTR